MVVAGMAVTGMIMASIAMIMMHPGIGMGRKAVGSGCVIHDCHPDGIWACRKSVSPMGASGLRSEEHTSELQSLMRSSYAVFCLKKKKTQNQKYNNMMHE